MIFDALLHPCQRKKEEKELTKMSKRGSSNNKVQTSRATHLIFMYAMRVCVCVCRQKETRCGQRPWQQIQCNKKCCLLASLSLSEYMCVCERMFIQVCVFVCESVAVSSSRARLSVPFVALLLNSASSSSLCVGKFRPWELHVKFRW